MKGVVFLGNRKLEVGFNAILAVMFWPLEIPPKIPPA